ncbi:FG-GAP repeat protein, partial [bacterium]|nr:FG-GAP repeat protein [bacterium]
MAGNRLVVGIPGHNPADRYLDTGGFQSFTTNGAFPTPSNINLRAEVIEKANEEDFGEKSLYDPGSRTLFIAAPGENTVYTYINEGLYWRASTVLSGGSQFGADMDTDGTRLAVGAPGANKVYIYKYHSGSETWVLQHTQSGDDSLSGDDFGAGNFGSAVAIDDDKLVIGAPAAELSYASDNQPLHDHQLDLGKTGLVHVFDRSGESWSWDELLMPYKSAMPDHTSEYRAPDVWNKITVNGNEYSYGFHAVENGEVAPKNADITLTPRTYVTLSDIYGDDAMFYAPNNSHTNNREFRVDRDYAALGVGSLQGQGGTYNYRTRREVCTGYFLGICTGHEWDVTNHYNATMSKGQNTINVYRVDEMTIPPRSFVMLTTNKDNGRVTANSNHSNSSIKWTPGGHEWQWITLLSLDKKERPEPITYNALASSQWGASVDIQGDNVYVGAPGEDAVAVYDLSGSGYAHWTAYFGSKQDSQPLRPVYLDDRSSGDLGASVVGQSTGHFYAGSPGAGDVHRYSRSGSSWSRQSVGSGNDLGAKHSITLVDNRMLLGATTEAGNTGAAYLFDANGSSKDLRLQPYTPSNGYDTTDHRHFGAGSSIISEGFYLIGSANANNGLDDRVYNFRHRGPSWSSVATYVPAKLPTAKIGASVSIDRETTVVGARDYDNRGAAFVFETGKKFDAAKYVRLQPSGLSLDADFGASVAVSGNTIVVGSPNAFDGAGAVYIFEYNGSEWSQSGEPLTKSGVKGFGSVVDIDASRLIVGAPESNLAVIFDRGVNKWTETASLTKSSEDFGDSVAVDGDMVVVGAPRGDSSDGVAYLYSLTSGSWNLDNALAAPDGKDNDYFGKAVAISAGYVAVGAPSNFDYKTLSPGSGVGNGAAYIFERKRVAFGAAAVDAGADEIIVGSGAGYRAGDEVIFEIAGGTIGGLSNGNRYFVISDGKKPGVIKLASQLSDVVDANGNPLSSPKPIDLGQAG